ncbi:anthranilate synthase component I [Staphylococcus argensis]|uniref:Anthranilate synthase component 1 n=1 Tax=Staphylococcus argensis TaxID=1607738 RepID=A0A2K4FF54_9STAP|nr:anthranilate synthase component I [Staphylococcus argensis]MCY6990410.1 anthranilate synthase component I [Staphylococcus argensis]POA09923.1 anthranilate synthase component I [Staphylococcus argensis]
MEVYYEKVKADVTPEAIARTTKKKIILESADNSQTKGRYSIVVLDVCGELTLDNEEFKATGPNIMQVNLDQPYQFLKYFLNEYKVTIDDEILKQLPFISGFIGSCSFDLVRHEFPKLQNIELADHQHHDLHFYMVEDVLVFDHYKEELYIIASNMFSNVNEAELEKRVQTQKGNLKNIPVFSETIPFETSQDKVVSGNISKKNFIENVRKFKKLISKGDMFQVVPSIIYSYAHDFGEQRFPLTFQMYQNLKRQNPSPYMYYLSMGNTIVVGSSPESFVKVKNNRVYTNPIAATIRRGATEEEDQALAEQLLSDEKELSEHRMLVDLGRNDIHRVSRPGTSKVHKLMMIERYEHVMHIVSEISGELDDLSPMEIITSLLPTGTVSGAPKLRAIQRIYETTPKKRGIYSGGIGYINCNHELDFALAIRTMIVDVGKVNVEAGCGVVYDSVPEKEYEETQMKAKSLLEVTP